MKVEVERINSTERKVDISIPVEDVDKNFYEIIQEFRKHSNVKGFRPGKTPIGVIESVYGKQIIGEVSAKLVNDTFYKALEDNNLTPVNKPRLKPEDLKKGLEFHYSAEFEVVPDFETEGYTGLELNKEIKEVKEGDVLEALERLRYNAAEAKPLEKDREVKEGDYVFIDQEGFLDDKSVKELKKENLQLIIGEKKLIEEFETNLVGMKIGDKKEFKVQYDENFMLEEARGKEVTFKITLNDIKERVLPELNDDFAKQYELKSMDELKEKIKEDLEKQLEKESEANLRKDVMKKLMDKFSFDIPKSLLDQEKNYLMNRYAYDYQSRGLEMPEMNEAILSTLDKRAQTSVKASIILSKVAKNEDIYVSNSELDTKISELASMYNIPFDKFKETYEKNNMVNSLESSLIEEKVLDFLVEKAKVTEQLANENEIDIKPEN